MNRRDFLRLSTVSAAAGLSSPRLFAAPQNYQGRLLLTLQAEGGWDVASFCDPKVNVNGEREITHWSNSDDIRKAGKIPYAPYGSNVAFFKKYYRHMMVINGIDAQTNAHSVGVLHNWSGRNASGFPSLTASFAAARAPDIPLSYLSFGGFSETSRLIRYSRLGDVEGLQRVLSPNVPVYDQATQYHSPAYIKIIQRARLARLRGLAEDESLLPLQRYNASSHLHALENKETLEHFSAVVADAGEFPAPQYVNDWAGESDLQRSIMQALLAFKAGVSCSGDLHLASFDTHSAHDQGHEALMAHLCDSVDFLWTNAGQLGLANRITLVIGSEFSRTPFYNSEDGKDHWPIGSMLVMEKNPSWGNRVVGVTDEGQNAHKINTGSLKRDDKNGTIIYPKHVHKALRSYLDLDSFAGLSDFPFNDTADFDLFSPTKRTVG